MDTRQVFYVPGQPGKPELHQFIDIAVTVGDQLVGYYEGKTLAQFQEDYPGVTLGNYQEVAAAQQNSLKTAPAAISLARYTEMLGVLPPEDWQHGGGGESFKLCEYYSGNITRIYVRIGKDYYEFLDDARITHAEIMAKVQAAFGRAPAAVH